MKILVALLHIFSVGVFASSDEELAKKINDPLSYIHGVFTESDKLEFSDNRSDSYVYRLQPVWAVKFDEKFSLIPRAVISYQTSKSSGTGTEVSGFGDSVLQLFYAPRVDSTWKWGLGPQLSFATRSKSELASFGNGLGLSGVITGNISENLSLAMIVGNLWSYDGSFSVLTLQPYLIYLIQNVPGLYLGYVQASSVNWKVSGDDNVNFPIGATLGKSWGFPNQYGFDLNIGAYRYVTKTDAAPENILKFGLGIIFP